jgi:NAD(P) transhydrogenase subunit alpha
MQIAVLREAGPGETRVALTPDAAKKLVAGGFAIAVEQGAGLSAGCADAAYGSAGARVVAERGSLLGTADVLACVGLPPVSELARLRKGAVLIGFLRPLDAPQELAPLLDLGLTAFAMELVPRSTRAQAMDALSSMATVVGYKAVLLAAAALPKMLPLLMTAAGTIPPAKVLVVGAGVAGLQAIATARRLGAMVEAYDVRRAAGEEVRSLGAKFIEVDLGGIETQDAGGYAVELSDEALRRGREAVARAAAASDIVITTAQVPGRRAPLMLEAPAVAAMAPGTVIVDLAGATGGNCALTRPGETYVYQGVTIMAPLNLAASVPLHASQLYARNVANFVGLLARDGALHVDLGDDILGPSCVVHNGQIVNARVAARLEQLQAKE